MSICLFVCLSATDHFHFPDLILEKGNTQYPCIFGRGLCFSSPPDAIGLLFSQKVMKLSVK